MPAIQHFLFPSNQLLLDHQDAIAPEHNDPIHELLDDLGEVSTIESLIGESFFGTTGGVSLVAEGLLLNTKRAEVMRRVQQNSPSKSGPRPAFWISKVTPPDASKSSQVNKLPASWCPSLTPVAPNMGQFDF